MYRNYTEKLEHKKINKDCGKIVFKNSGIREGSKKSDLDCWNILRKKIRMQEKSLKIFIFQKFPKKLKYWKLIEKIQGFQLKSEKNLERSGSKKKVN